MEYELNENTFFVNELLKPQLLNEGTYAYYTVEKKGLSHKQLLKRLPKDACFCGVKDKNATTKQYFSTKQRIEEIVEPNLKVKMMGFNDKKLFIGAHKGNSFKVLVKLSNEEEKKLKKFSEKKEFVCNYFGEQRFNSKTRTLLELFEKEDYENALKLFLTQKTKFDSDKSREIKKIIEENWGNWNKINENELIQNTGKKELFDFLEKNPKDFQKAFEFAENKSLKQTIKSIQALRWNNELKKEALLKKTSKNIFGEINEEKVSLSASKAFKRQITIEPTEFEQNFRKGILERNTFFAAQKFKAKKLEKRRYELCFELGKGQYATIFLKFLDKWLEKNKK
ncbi:MAG: tRNA pseudouridine(13) synthase TruD [Sphaerochaetaceae bacterium]|nr:tRNA pseudouridine(13) synthase TruD [Sphaerochaetaceae bacterium]